MTELKYAWRMVTKSPLFTTIVVVTLALGIGLNTAVFSAVEAMLLRPLGGARAPEELVQLYRSWPEQRFGSNSVTHYLDLREQSKDVLTDVASWSFVTVNITANGEPQRVFGAMTSANYFEVAGAQPQLGRFFTPEEDAGVGAHPVTVLSDGAWRTRFGADPTVVGRPIVLNGQSYTVVGVARPGFAGMMPIVEPVLWVPLMQIEHVRPGTPSPWENRGNNFLNVFGRLKPGVSVEQVEQRLSAINTEIAARFPGPYEGSGITVVKQANAGIHPIMRDAQVAMSMVVMVVVAILLLVACVNVANLFLARARDRAREMAIRLSLGAKRWSLVRQLLVESLLFSALSGAAGIALAYWVIGLGNRIALPMDISFRPDLQLSMPVLGFALAVTLVTGLVFGLVPALQATRPSLVPALKGEAPAGGSRSRVVKGLIVAQMALSIVLLVCAGLFLDNLRSATNVDKGFAGEGVMLADLDPSMLGYDRARTLDFYARLESQLRSDPRVRSIGFIDNIPLGLSNSDRGVSIPGYTPGENENMSIGYVSVTPGYFEAMGIPLLKGRPFEARDDSGSVRVMVVNEQFAQRYWPDQEAVGRTVLVGQREFTVIGVVPTGKYQRLGEPASPHMYFAQQQMYVAGMTLALKVDGDPAALIPVVRAAVRGLDSNLPVANPRTMDVHLGIALMPARITGLALGVFGLLGLILASVGMYGVMAYSVSQRTREIGIRMATGASTVDVIRLIMRQGLTLVLIGVVIGLAGALGAAQLLRAVLYGEQAVNFTTFTLVPLVLVGVSALATWVPARRAALVDPAITLRAD